MRNEFLNPGMSEMFMEQFERDGLEKALGCGPERSREIVNLRRARQLKDARRVLGVLKGIERELRLETHSLGG